MVDPAHELLLSAAASLPAGPCKQCEREVLAYPIAGDGGAEGYACVHCDAALRRIYLVTEDDLETLGYGVEDPTRQGCGTGCAAGGCGVKKSAG